MAGRVPLNLEHSPQVSLLVEHFAGKARRVRRRAWRAWAKRWRRRLADRWP